MVAAAAAFLAPPVGRKGSCWSLGPRAPLWAPRRPPHPGHSVSRPKAQLQFQLRCLMSRDELKPQLLLALRCPCAQEVTCAQEVRPRRQLNPQRGRGHVLWANPRRHWAERHRGQEACCSSALCRHANLYASSSAGVGFSSLERSLAAAWLRAAPLPALAAGVPRWGSYRQLPTRSTARSTQQQAGACGGLRSFRAGGCTYGDPRGWY